MTAPVPDGRTDPDAFLYEWAAANVDYLTALCLGPAVDVILDGWKAGGAELPWTDAGENSSDEEDADSKPHSLDSSQLS